MDVLRLKKKSQITHVQVVRKIDGSKQRYPTLGTNVQKSFSESKLH